WKNLREFYKKRKIMYCPLCQSKNNQKELFKTLNAFTSTVKFDTKQLINNLDDSDSGGGVL
ncbi:TPA: hypothetical protein ACW3V7_001144, partial [Campylobacter jejuni]